MKIIRNLVEYLVIFAIWAVLWLVLCPAELPAWVKILVLLAVAWSKCIFFGGENLHQLWNASCQNMPYHRFMLVMLVNMSQIILSFGLDYHCLHCIAPESFGGIAEGLLPAALVFELCWYSVLNFTFFGFGDVTPLTIPAKLLTMTEILLAFVTVIFLLSDFISLKESIAPRRPPPATGA